MLFDVVDEKLYLLTLSLCPNASSTFTHIYLGAQHGGKSKYFVVLKWE